MLIIFNNQLVKIGFHRDSLTLTRIRIRNYS